MKNAWTVDLFLSLLGRDTLLVALAGLLCLVACRRSASARAMVLSATLGLCVVVPLVSLSMDGHPVAIATPAAHGPALITGEGEVASEELAAAAATAATQVEAARPVQRHSAETVLVTASTPEPWIRLDLLFVYIWLVGVGVGLSRIAASHLALRRVRNNVESLPLSTLCPATIAIIRDVRTSRPLVVAKSSQVDLPATFGVLRPVIVLPDSAETWPQDQIDAAVVHELTHVRRWDCLWALIARIACAACWVNPLVHLASRRLRLEQERACDAAVLEGGTSPRRYLQMLIGLAHGVSNRPEGAALSMARPSQILSRAEAIVDGRPRALVRGRWLATCVGVLAIGGGSLALMGVAKVDERDELVDAELLRLQSIDNRERQRAAWALGELESARAVDELITLLKDEDPEVRATAAWALGEIKDDRAEAALIEHLADTDPIVREMIILAMGELENTSTVESLLGATTDDNASIRRAAAWALGQIRGTTGTLVHLASSDPDAGVRAEAMRWLPKRSSETLRVLIDRANDADRGVRIQAIGALGATENPLATPTLLAMIDSAQPNGVRVAAAQALGKIGDPAAVDALLGLLRDADHDVRAMAVWSLDEINPSRDS